MSDSENKQISIAALSKLADQMMPEDIPETKYVHAIKQLQVGRIREEIKMYLKIHEVMLEYQGKLAEFDQKRAAIINGEYEPTDDECKYEFAGETAIEPTEEKGIPNFWQTIFQNLDMFNSNISEKDVEVLKYLKNIRYEMLASPAGFKLFFEFNENPFFSNSELTKTYYYSDKIDVCEPLAHSQLVIERTEGCKIEWKSPEQNVTEIDDGKDDSFFNFFDPPTVVFSEASPMDQELLNSDFDMGETLYSSIIPRAVVYYTGEGIEDDGDYDDDEFDEEDDYANEEDDEEEEEAAPKVRRTGRRRD